MSNTPVLRIEWRKKTLQNVVPKDKLPRQIQETPEKKRIKTILPMARASEVYMTIQQAQPFFLPSSAASMSGSSTRIGCCGFVPEAGAMAGAI